MKEPRVLLNKHAAQRRHIRLVRARVDAAVRLGSIGMLERGHRYLPGHVPDYARQWYIDHGIDAGSDHGSK